MMAPDIHTLISLSNRIGLSQVSPRVYYFCCLSFPLRLASFVYIFLDSFDAFIHNRSIAQLQMK